MTKFLSHVSMLDMLKLGLFLLLICATSLDLFAYEATVSVYTFEHRATNNSKKIKLEDRTTPLPTDAPWFDWTCLAQKQVDGVNIRCERGNESTETKIFCYVHDSKEARYLKVGKGDNFVSFETRCRLSLEERRAIARAKMKKKKKKPSAPESEIIPVPPTAAPEAAPAEAAPVAQPELQVAPPAGN